MGKLKLMITTISMALVFSSCSSSPIIDTKSEFSIEGFSLATNLQKLKYQFPSSFHHFTRDGSTDLVYSKSPNLGEDGKFSNKMRGLYRIGIESSDKKGDLGQIRFWTNGKAVYHVQGFFEKRPECSEILDLLTQENGPPDNPKSPTLREIDDPEYDGGGPLLKLTESVYIWDGKSSTLSFSCLSRDKNVAFSAEIVSSQANKSM